jgi:cell wall-associated NlpC family hydrolase
LTLGTTPESSDSPTTQPETSQHISRRQAREAKRGIRVPAIFRPAKAKASSSTPVRGKKPAMVNLAVMTLVVPGLFATVALPAYAFLPGSNTQSENGAAGSALSAINAAQSQQIVVDATVAAPAAARDAMTATTTEQLRAAQAAQRQQEIAAQRAALRTQTASYSGPSAREFLANPAYPNFSLDQVAAVAQQYIGVPYRYGGADPSGFDCSGFVMFVYAQFGISLPHGVRGQGAAGTVISREDARPGDVVIFNDGSHNGFWMGNGNILDAPRPGKAVQTRPLWTDAYYIVRFGI